VTKRTSIDCTIFYSCTWKIMEDILHESALMNVFIVLFISSHTISQKPNSRMSRLSSPYHPITIGMQSQVFLIGLLWRINFSLYKSRARIEGVPIVCNSLAINCQTTHIHLAAFDTQHCAFIPRKPFWNGALLKNCDCGKACDFFSKNSSLTCLLQRCSSDQSALHEISLAR